MEQYEIETGIYRHFKGNLYEVLGTVRHSETEEVFVLYRALYGDQGLWVRPFEMFCEKVDKAAYPQVEQEYRFEKVREEDEAFSELGMKCDFDCSMNDLNEAKRQIDSILHKLEATLETFLAKDDSQRYKSQITLARRRIGALELANSLIKCEMNARSL
ncbi:DUF1653 domain-containing protein [uncultured Slackia sp.]|uniref:DUF1653 domain-containing protein n=1 Tax=uncultured Slackia sp. TaxID=665903 RepID=UPI002639FE4B|nr:DUF1653 domain-containing protein [uncultured Slackia sp.]